MRNILITFFIAIFLIPLILSFFIKEIPNDTQASLEGTRGIYKDSPVTQFFRSNRENLSGIGTSIKNPNFRNKKDLILNLYDSDKSVVRTVTRSGYTIPDGDFIILRFTPIKDSKNKTFYFTLSSPNSESNEAFETFLSSQKIQWIGDLYINSEKSESKIPFVLYHKPNNFLSAGLGIFGQFFRRFLTDIYFAIFYLIIVGGIVSYLVYSKKSS
jgi:hypothetical protein